MIRTWPRIRARWRSRWLAVRWAARQPTRAWVAVVAIASFVWPVYAWIAYRFPIAPRHYAPLLALPAAIGCGLMRGYARSGPHLGRFRRQLKGERIVSMERSLRERRHLAKEIKRPFAVVYFFLILPVLAVLRVSGTAWRSRPGARAAWIGLAIAVPVVMFFVLRIRGRRDESLPEFACPKCGYDLRATPERCPECGFRRVSQWDRMRKMLDLRDKRIR